MPVYYEFKCPECQTVVDVNDIDDPPQCYRHDDPVTMKRVYHLYGVSFKGPGFYRTDNK